MAVFKDVYQQYGKKVYLYLLSLTGNVDEAEELMAETFYQAFLHIDNFEGRSSIYTWLCQIGKNAWLKECQRKKRFDYREIIDIEQMGVESADRASSPEQNAIKQEEVKRIMQEIFKLEEPYKEVFMLHVFGEMKLKDIAKEYSKTEEWARVTYYRAKNKLKKVLL